MSQQRSIERAVDEFRQSRRLVEADEEMLATVSRGLLTSTKRVKTFEDIVALINAAAGSGTVVGSVRVFNVTADPYNAAVDGVTNALPAINAATAAALAAGGGIVYFPNGHYLLGEDYNANTNSLITVPLNENNYVGEPPTIVFMGESPGFTAGSNYDTYGGGVLLDASACVAATGTRPSVLSACRFAEITNWTLDVSKWSRISVRVENLMIWTPGGASSLCGINLHNCMQGSVGDNVRVGVKFTTSIVQPTSAVGVILPAHLNNVVNIGVGRNVDIYGYYDGLWVSEHAVLQRPYIGGCVNGLRLRFAAHPIVGDAAIEDCVCMVVVDPAATTCPVNLRVHGELNRPGAWYDAAAYGGFLNDITGNLTGRITYSLLSTAVGGLVVTPTNVEIIGAGKVVLENSNADAGNTPFLNPILLAKYNLSDTADVSGNARTLTNHNGVTFVAGKIGNAASFNGTTQYLSNAALHVSDSFTVCAWVKFSDTATNDCFIAEQGGSGLRFAAFKLANESIYAEFYDTASNVATPTSAAGQSTGAWHFVVLQWNNTSKVGRIKVDNGSWIAAAALANTLATAGTPTFTIGCRLNASTSVPENFFGGQVDAVRVEPILTSDADLTARYNAGAGTEA